MDKVRFGILGCAGIARKQFIPAIRQAENAQLAAVASRTIEKARQFGDAYQIPLQFGPYEEMLASDQIDAVYIALPNGLHKEWALKSAAAGKHILCEKPLAPTAADCREMGKAAQANGVLLMEAFMYLFHPITEKVLADVRAGVLGGMEMVQANHSYLLTDESDIRLQPELCGGSLMDIGCYCVNVARTLLDEEPAEVAAVAHFRENGVDDQMSLLARFTSGRSALLSCGFVSATPPVFTVSGLRGFVHAHQGFHLGIRNGTVISNIDSIQSTLNDPTNEYTRMIAHFSDCVLHHQPLRYDFEDAARNMAVIEAALQSAHANGEWTKV